MDRAELKEYLYKDTIADEHLGSILPRLDKLILSNSENISEETFGIYKKFQPMKQNAPIGMKNELFRAVRNFIVEKFSKDEKADTLLLSRFLVVKAKLVAGDLSILAECVANFEQFDLALDFLKFYEEKESNLPLKLLTLGNFYNLKLKDYKKAIKYYEHYLKIDETKSVIYTILASLYAKAYGDLSLEDQVRYFEKAYKLKPNDRLVLHGLAFGYEKLKNLKMANKFYEKLIQNNPTETDFYNYGAFLISCGEFESGHKYFTHRFSTGDKNLEYPISYAPEKRWNLKSDISDKVLLIHYEQGFGDTFMYCRFVPMMKNLAKQVIFVVQDSLYDLIKNSKIISDGVMVVSECQSENLEYDLHMALLDTPFVLKISAQNLPLCEKYLEVEDDKVKVYADKYLNKSNRIKVGICLHGNKSANYKGRDIELSKMQELFNLKDVEFYLLTEDKETEIQNLIPLGETFETFTDTACAVKNMDVVLSTDNVILNLAGSLGVKTLGLFTKYPNFRWFKLSGNDVGWYKSVRPVQIEDFDCNSALVSNLINYISDCKNA
jgi:tetratricopeptide repeat protein